jgi:hypothetical protein
MLLFEPPTVTLPRDLTGWVSAYSVIVWPALFATTKELVDLGYALPRLDVQQRSTWRAGTIVALAWAWQLAALPFLPAWWHLISRVMAALAVTSTMTTFYLVRAAGCWRRSSHTGCPTPRRRSWRPSCLG